MHILLQNENGPCPLLAASNCLLLKGLLTLPPRAIRNGVTSLDDITNMLANFAMHTQQQQQNQHTPSKTSEEFSSSFLQNDTQNQFSLNEFMTYIPNFQYGMDVNPKFTVGCQGYEYTAELSVLSDMLGCKLLHGWLIDPIQDEATAIAVGNKSYNELVERAIVGKDAEMDVSKIQVQIEEILYQYPHIDNMPIDDDDDVQEDKALVNVRDNLSKLRKQQNDLQDVAIAVQLIETFLADSSHQLTTYGLEQLHTTIRDREICIMFRNNHFSTITRHGDNLYLLVTDLGYANTSRIVWEKLDVVDGDTEFCDSFFICNPSMASMEEQSGPTLTPEQMMATSGQNDVDYQLALQLSMQVDNNNNSTVDTSTMDGYGSNPTCSNVSNGTIVALPTLPANSRIEVGVPLSKRNTNTSESDQEAMDRLLALQLQQERIPILNNENDEAASLWLARQLQEEENANIDVVRATNNHNSSTGITGITGTNRVEDTAQPPNVQRPPNAQRLPNTSAKANSSCTIM